MSRWQVWGLFWVVFFAFVKRESLKKVGRGGTDCDAAGESEEVIVIQVDAGFEGACKGSCGSVECPCLSLRQALVEAFTLPMGSARLVFAPGNYSGQENSGVVFNSSTISVTIQ